MILALLSDALLILALFSVGVFLAASILQGVEWLELFSLGFPLGAGLLSWLLFILSWAGLRLNVWTLLLALSTVLLSLSILLIRRKSTITVRMPDLDSGIWRILRRNPLKATVWLSVLALFGLSALISVGRSYSMWDSAAIWSVKGYGIALGGDIFSGRVWGAHALTYPLNIPLLISFFRLASGDIVPGSKLIFPVFYAALMIGIYGFWRRFKLPDLTATLGILFLCLVPLVFFHATIGYTNLILATYLLFGFFYSLRGMLYNQWRLQLMGGIFLGLAAWTRLEGIMYCLALLLAILISQLITKRFQIRLISWLSPLVVIAGMWLLFLRLYGSESHAGSALQDWSSEGWKYINLPAISNILGYLREQVLNPELWGVYFVVIAVLLVSGLRGFHPSDKPEATAALIAALGLAASTITLFYVATYSFGVDYVAGWLERGFPRASLPATLMFGVAVFLLESPSRSRGNREVETQLTGESTGDQETTLS